MKRGVSSTIASVLAVASIGVPTLPIFAQYTTEQPSAIVVNNVQDFINEYLSTKVESIDQDGNKVTTYTPITNIDESNYWIVLSAKNFYDSLSSNKVYVSNTDGTYIEYDKSQEQIDTDNALKTEIDAYFDENKINFYGEEGMVAKATTIDENIKAQEAAAQAAAQQAEAQQQAEAANEEAQQVDQEEQPVQEEIVETEKVSTLESKDSTKTITAQLSTEVPASYKLVVQELVPSEEYGAYDEAKAEVENYETTQNLIVTGDTYYYDIHFEDENGNEVEPEGITRISIHINGNTFDSSLMILHLNEASGVEKLLNTSSQNDIEFTSTSFSTFVFANGVLTSNTTNELLDAEAIDTNSVSQNIAATDANVSKSSDTTSSSSTTAQDFVKTYLTSAAGNIYTQANDINYTNILNGLSTWNSLSQEDKNQVNSILQNAVNKTYQELLQEAQSIKYGGSVVKTGTETNAGLYAVACGVAIACMAFIVRKVKKD